MGGVIRVLVVDDDPLVRVGLSLVLGAGKDLQIVGEAGDGAEAVEMTRRLRPDVVLMDIRMPRMDGLAATREIRREGAEPAVIVLTTFDTDEHLLGALRLGANGFLLKDIAPESILDAVRRAAAGESILAPSVVPRLIGYAVGREAGDLSPPGPGSADGASGLGRGSSVDGAPGFGRGGATAGASGLRRGGATAGAPGLGRGGAGDGARGLGRSGAAEGSRGLGRDGAADSAAGRARVALARLGEREREVADAVATGRSNAEISVELHMSVDTVKAHVSRLLEKLGCANRVQIAILVHESRW
nr:response regulator transcription factor [Actinoplanes sp. L3-i22]